MELQELVERIERWKNRIALESSDDIMNEASPEAVEAGAIAPSISADELDFEEMDMADLPIGDSGLLEQADSGLIEAADDEDDVQEVVAEDDDGTTDFDTLADGDEEDEDGTAGEEDEDEEKEETA